MNLNIDCGKIIYMDDEQQMIYVKIRLARVEFANHHLAWTPQQWAKVLWIDKSKSGDGFFLFFSFEIPLPLPLLENSILSFHFRYRLKIAASSGYKLRLPLPSPDFSSCCLQVMESSMFEDQLASDFTHNINFQL